jgi:hypothetical protein
MAGYSNTGLRCIVDRIGDGPAVWYYSSVDAHGTVDNASYFTDGYTFGMRVNDVVIVVDTDSATCTIHSVATAVQATGYVTINAATLS